ncbi:MAG: hypothetical protein Q9167_007705 [Letrouitia subvulpina]
MTDPAFKAMATARKIGNVPAPVANRQAIAYIQKIATATTSVPLPQFVSSLPKDQQAAYSRMAQGLSQRLATADIQVAKAAVSDVATAIAVNGTSINGTTAVNGTGPSNSTSPGRSKSSSSRKMSTTPPPQQPTSNPAPGPAANTTNSPGFGNPAQPTGAMKAAGAVAVGLMGPPGLSWVGMPQPAKLKDHITQERGGPTSSNQDGRLVGGCTVPALTNKVGCQKLSSNNIAWKLSYRLHPPSVTILVMQLTLALLTALLPALAFSQFDGTGDFDDGFPAFTLTGLNADQASALSSFEASVTSDTKAQNSLITAFTAVPTGILDEAAISSGLQAAVTGGKAADIKFPKDYPAPITSYLNSIYDGEVSILNKYASKTGNYAPAITGRLAAAGAIAAGVVGVAVL